ncbi:MAG TPA: PAS domain-containing protein [Terriglobales bacterium]
MVLIVAFAKSLLLVRRLVLRITADESLETASSSAERVPLHTYNGIIQELKQQKHELLALQQSERRRAKTTENISAAVLSNLSSGVLFLTSNGQVRRANAAARTILGFASPNGMTIDEIFRKAKLISSDEPAIALASFVQDAVHRQSDAEKARARYFTPSGEHKILDVTVTCVRAESSEVLGAACLVADETEVVRLHSQQQWHGEMSSEMALALRTSLATISGYAQQIEASDEIRIAHQFAIDIVTEAEELDQTIGGFLAGENAAVRTVGA